MNVWEKLKTVLWAIKAFYVVLLVIYLGFGAAVTQLIAEPVGMAVDFLSVFLATAPLTLAFAAIGFLIRFSVPEENAGSVHFWAVYGGAGVILFVAASIGAALGYPTVEPLTLPLRFPYILGYPIELFWKIMTAYGLGPFFASFIFGTILAGGIL
jgi:hypothetical protein